MSRSIHATRRELEEAHRLHYRDRQLKEAIVKSLEKALDRKRQIKRSVLDERGTERSSGAEVDGLVPVRIEDVGPYVHYPAMPADLHAIQQRLPRGVMDGVSEVVLLLGVEEQDEAEREDPIGAEADPWTGRLGREILPGIYQGWVLGTYYRDPCRIALYAYVADSANPPALPTTAFLKLTALATFVHEVAHHFDQTRRAARGRWLALDEIKEKKERSAQRYQHEWTQNCVVPFLQETYPQEVGTLQDWVEHYGGVRLSLGKFVSDPRTDVNWLIYVFPVEAALQHLNEHVAAARPLNECRLDFANELHYAAMYEEALTAIQTVIHEEPESEGAWTLRADIWVHQERFPEAEALASRLVEKNPHNDHARRHRADAYAGLGRWDRVIDATTEDLQFLIDEFDRQDAIYRRCRAYWKLGKTAESDDDLRILEAAGARWKRRVKELKKERQQPAPSAQSVNLAGRSATRRFVNR